MVSLLFAPAVKAFNYAIANHLSLKTAANNRLICLHIGLLTPKLVATITGEQKGLNVFLIKSRVPFFFCYSGNVVVSCLVALVSILSLTEKVVIFLALLHHCLYFCLHKGDEDKVVL